ncbi:hypothetical protein [Sporosarcina sp. ITBMC105]
MRKIHTDLLFYKIHKMTAEPNDYVCWAIGLLENNQTSPSLLMLASLRTPFNPFEVENYFHRAVRELAIQRPSIEACSMQVTRCLLSKVVEEKEKALDHAYTLYQVLRDDFPDADSATWFALSELIDDYRYGDNSEKLTEDELIRRIVEKAKEQLDAMDRE